MYNKLGNTKTPYKIKTINFKNIYFKQNIMSVSNFDYHNPVQIFFGKGEIAKLSTILPKDKKIMITYGGGSIKKNGVYDQVIAALKGFNYIEFGGIEPNPKVETLRKAIELGKKEKVDFLLPVGGGSVIDGTKLIAVALLIENDAWDVVTNKILVEKAVPIGAILTLPATGTEMNGNSVVSNTMTKEKYGWGSRLVMPKFSILDPEVCYTLPDIQIANGIVDTFVHVMEQYNTYPVNAMIQDRFAESILQTLVEIGPKVMADKTNYEHTSNFMWSATVALNGLIGSGVPNDWATHVIGHEITALHEVDHAQTLAIVLPGVMSVLREGKRDKILQYGARVFNVTAGTEEQKIDETINKTIQFFESVGIKTRLSDYGIGKATIDEIVNRFEKRGFSFGERGDINPAKVRQILECRL